MSHTRMSTAYLHLLIMSPDPYFTSFSLPDHNSRTIRNVLMVLDKITVEVSAEYKKGNSAFFVSLLCPLTHIFFIFNFRTIRNILVVLGRIIEQVHMESYIQE